MNKYPDQFKEGKSKEQDFIDVARNNGFSISHANPSQDRYQHWDIKLTKSHKIDVKGLKKIRRGDRDVQEIFHYAEIKNVEGKPGWCYSDYVDMFAFETFDYWIIVKKQDLQDMLKEKVSKVWSTSPELYKMYHRNGRKDIITLVKTIDLMFIAYHKLKK